MTKSRPEPLVDFHLVPARQAIGLIRHPDYCHQLGELLIGHAGLARRGGVGGDAVAALVAGADSDVHHLLGQRVERARRHHLFHGFPCAPQRYRIVRQSLPEIVDPICVASGHDVVINRAHVPRSVSIFNHCLLPGSYLISRPPFITNATRRTAVMSSKGLPATATKSASKPGATVPIVRPSPSDSAATEVPLRIASIGLSPPSLTR